MEALLQGGRKPVQALDQTKYHTAIVVLFFAPGYFFALM